MGLDGELFIAVTSNAYLATGSRTTTSSIICVGPQLRRSYPGALRSRSQQTTRSRPTARLFKPWTPLNRAPAVPHLVTVMASDARFMNEKPSTFAYAPLTAHPVDGATPYADVETAPGPPQYGYGTGQCQFLTNGRIDVHTEPAWKRFRRALGLGLFVFAAGLLINRLIKYQRHVGVGRMGTYMLCLCY